MSADNGYVIRFRDDGLYVLQMYFTSNDSYPDIYAANAITGHTVDELVKFYSAWMKDDGYLSEYGLTIDLSNEKKEVPKKMESIDIQKFVRRPFAVRGLRVTVENHEAVAEWANGVIQYDDVNHKKFFIKIDVKNALNEKQKQARVGDWVLNTQKGFKIYTNRAFHANFVGAEDVEPKKPAPAQIVNFDLTNLPSSDQGARDGNWNDPVSISAGYRNASQSDFVRRG